MYQTIISFELQYPETLSKNMKRLFFNLSLRLKKQKNIKYTINKKHVYFKHFYINKKINK